MFITNNIEITLLKDYIYIPIGGNKKGEFHTYKNLVITFLIGGIWHGAGWTYVIWGLLHGFALVINRLWKKLNIKLHSFVAWFITFNFVNITWVFFRAKSFQDALTVLEKMSNFSYLTDLLFNNQTFISIIMVVKAAAFDKTTLITIFIALLSLIWKSSIEHYRAFKPTAITATVAIFISIIAVMNLNKVSEFLYFQF